MPPRKYRIVLRLAMGVLTFLILLFLIEAGARLYLGDRFIPGFQTGVPTRCCAQIDPHLGWFNIPCMQTRIVASSFDYDVEINSKGLRDREHEYEPPPGVQRVLLLGDSLVWGWGVNAGYSFGDLVEERLGPCVEVINLGVPAYSTDQELWLLEKEGLRYKPDLVLLCFLLNDISGNNSPKMSGMEKPVFKRNANGEWKIANYPVPEKKTNLQQTPEVGCMQWLMAHSAFFKLFQSDPDTRDYSEITPAQWEFLAKENANANKLCDELVDPRSATYYVLGQIKKRCDTLGIPLLAFSIPHKHDRYLLKPDFPRPPEWPENGPDEFQTCLSRRLSEAGRMLGFETFSVDQALLDAVNRGELLNVGDGHLNNRGNEVVAEVLVAKLGPILESLRH